MGTRSPVRKGAAQRSEVATLDPGFALDDAAPDGIVTEPDGKLCFTKPGTNKIGTIPP